MGRPVVDRDTLITTGGVDGLAQSRRGSRLRVGFMVLTMAVVVLALAGFFGVRTATVTATSQTMTVQVGYTAISRRGVTTPWSLEVRRADGFSGAIAVTVSSGYLSRLSVRRITPEPDSVTSDGDRVTWKFNPPDGDRFALELDCEVDPSAKPGWIDGRAAVEVDGAKGPTLHYRTWIWP